MEIVRDELTPEGSRFPLPSTPQIVTVTPEMASDWLSYRNHPKNRPMSKAVSFKYQKDMEADRWRSGTPEGYIFDTEGYIISGQHRMKAQANSNTTLEVWIFPAEPREIFEVVDQGYKRTAAHVLNVPYAVNIAAAARHLAALADGDRWGMPRFSKITTPEVVATFHAWPELTWYIKDIQGASLEASIPVGPHAAVIAQAARSSDDLAHDLIQTWLAGVRTGEDLGARDPRLHLRRRFHGGLPTGKGKRDHAYALIVKAWNAYAAGEDITILRHMSTEPLPKVAGFDFERKSA
ncbi:hypothetical protein [Streptomyces paludis]|uniref:ParB/Sulfiredoxin domain-containing protein n=1 Tax=Streptomyces paludis TaxID=2282738 RepID=A0A345HWU2_9ACTN|nr:hypothetical protein [Streptomyces paludis]AXG81166.1 hypothetical protein DVK44_29640 [Streptomyces paludis]